MEGLFVSGAVFTVAYVFLYIEVLGFADWRTHMDWCALLCSVCLWFSAVIGGWLTVGKDAISGVLKNFGNKGSVTEVVDSEC
jgi:hypothetical protein